MYMETVTKVHLMHKSSEDLQAIKVEDLIFVEVWNKL